MTGRTSGGEHEPTQGENLQQRLVRSCSFQLAGALTVPVGPPLSSDGDLREAVLLWEVQDHFLQHEGLHEPDGPPAEPLHGQPGLPEGPGRNVSEALMERGKI